MSVATAAALLSGCSIGDDVMTALGSSTSETAPAHGQSGAELPGPGQPGEQHDALVMTDQQRAYLEALRAAGLKPSSDLLALSIGSYVCQARAAKQTDQEVWDFVAPLVRSDVRNARFGSTSPPASEVDSATADYIRIATGRLC